MEDFHLDSTGAVIAKWPEDVLFTALDTFDAFPFYFKEAGLVGGDEFVS